MSDGLSPECLQIATSINGVDLLSVVVHECGHLLGFDR